MQWHLSEACNLKCLHCYQENHKPVQLQYEELISILNQYKELLKKLNQKGHINLTGGEPLCCPFFFQILNQFQHDKELYSFSILTNGTLIDDQMAKRISEYHPEYVQVSLEGGRKMNDHIRGKRVYQKVAHAIKHLKKYNIFVSISFTATKINYMEFSKVVQFALKYKVDNVWSDRFIPIGSENDPKLLMSLEETNQYLDIMKQERQKLKHKNSKTTISMYRALQFQKTNDFPYSCSAGNSLLTVMENGDLVPCRRMPIVIGNLLQDNMYDLYCNHEVLKQLQKRKIPTECEKCEHAQLCNGGLKCLTFALYHDLNHKDVGCML